MLRLICRYYCKYNKIPFYPLLAELPEEKFSEFDWEGRSRCAFYFPVEEGSIKSIWKGLSIP
jgi:hypothetical protein